MSVLMSLTRLVQGAAEAKSPVLQVNHIVDGIQRDMDVDVCSLYLSNDSEDLVLVASHGLGESPGERSIIPRGKGLVGSVAQSRHPINLVDPASHPAFYYLPGSGEERFQSFCGVPLVRAGAVVGVLVVQRQEARKLNQEEEAFLVTLATQLALVVANWRDWEIAGPEGPRAYTGVKGARGVGIGRVYLCEMPDLSSVLDSPCTDKESALAEWRRLVAQVQAELRSEQLALGASVSHEVAGIFDAYILLLADPALSTGVEEAIKGGQDLPSALKAVIHHYSELFLAMDDPYLRARHEDIQQLGNRLYGAWRRSHDSERDIEVDGPVILVGSQVSVSDIASVPRERIAGIVSFQGSVLSHIAVLANALGLPAVLGVGEIHGLRDGNPMLVDGNSGMVLLNPEDTIVREYEELVASEQKLRRDLEELRDKPAVTTDGQKINLYANSGLLADISPGLANGAEGLGLYRTEIPFMVGETFPSEQEQCQLYETVLNAYEGKPVYMRILDVGADKPLPYFPVHEENPALGWRGIRFCLDNTSLLMTQLRAMLRAGSGHSGLRIMLPMVSSAAELQAFHELLDDALAQLQEEGFAVSRPQVGIMVEVPAAISQLEKWRASIDFISIGSNDLSQYLIAVDRNNPKVAKAYDHLHPSVLSEIERVTGIAGKLDLPVSLCGEMSSDPAAVVLLVGMGIRTLSLSAARLPRIKWLIRSIDTGQAESLLHRAAQLSASAEIRSLVNGYLDSLEFPGSLY